MLGANIWTTNDNALYTGSLGLSNITKVRKRPMVIVSGVLGTALAVWLYNNFVSWLNFLNATLPPIGMIIMMDYFMHRASYGADTVVHRKINWGAIAGVVAGAIVGNLTGGTIIPTFSWGISAVNAMVVAGVIYFLVDKLYYKGDTGVSTTAQ